MTITQALEAASASFTKAGIDSARLDAELLSALLLKKDRSWIIAHGDTVLAPDEDRRFSEYVKKRSERIPLAYLLGHKEFFGYDFLVTKKTLIPRPETEILVQSALDYIKEYSAAQSLLDLGTGSGAIACCIAVNAPQLSRIMAIDVSTAALEVAKQNAARLGLTDRIQFKRMHMGRMQTLKGPFDLIVSNPPYLSEKEYAAARKDCPELSEEPQIALIGGKDGFTFITTAIRVSRKLLSKNGALFLEIGVGQGDAMKRLVSAHLPNYSVRIIPDLAGHPRVAAITPIQA